MKVIRWIKQNRRQVLTASALLLVYYTLVFSGIFAYFTSRDSVSNSLAARQSSVMLYEPMWDSAGREMAQHSEPGMNIPKNPYAVNDGQTDLYIRLKVTITLGDYEGSLRTSVSEEGEVARPTNQKRFSSIIDAIKLKTKDAGDNDIYVDLLTWNDSSWSCANGKFAVYPTDTAPPSGNSMELYFYYTNGSNDGTMFGVSPGETTEELFHRLEIPIYKADYLGVFDQDYDINIQAQALPTGTFVQPPTPQTFAEAYD